MFPVGCTSYFTLVRPRGAHQPFIVQAGDYILHHSIAVLIPHFRIEWLKARRQDDRPYFHLYLLRRLSKIDRVVRTDGLANITFLLFQVQATFIDVSDQRDSLGEVDMDSFIRRYILIKWIGVLDRAILNTGRTTRTNILENVSRLSGQGYFKVP